MYTARSVICSLLRKPPLFENPTCFFLYSNRDFGARRKYNQHKEYNGRKLVGFSMQQMYNVVADIENYKRFIPFCKESSILSTTTSGCSAELQIGFPPISESYISEVTLIRPRLVRAICKDGRLFKSLETCWKFGPGIDSNKRSSIVDFSIHFEFKSDLHKQLANMFFDMLVKQMESAFLDEAKKRYGSESLPTHELSYVKS